MNRKAARGTVATKARYMLDANSFDYILDHGIEPRFVRGLGEIFITNIQHAELMRVPDPSRRKKLLQVLAGINPTVRPASVGVWLKTLRQGDTIAGQGKTSDVAKQLYGASRKPAKWNDAAIGEAASLEGFILVTDDRRFRHNAAALGVSTLSCAEAFGDCKT